MDGKRALPNQMVNIRDKKSKVFIPPKLDWNKYPESLYKYASDGLVIFLCYRFMVIAKQKKMMSILHSLSALVIL